MKKKIAVILAGCGKADGAEIHESTMALLAIDQQGAEYHIFAPNITQHDVINHITNEPMKEERNVLVESARIARGEIKDLKELDMANFDALVMPGGFGAAKNLCSFAFKGEEMTVNEDVAKAIKTAHKEGKPIGAMCIAPVMVAKVLTGSVVTLGDDKDIAKMVQNWNSKHENTVHGEITVDADNKVVTTACYMLGGGISEVYDGATALVKQVLAWT